MNGDVINSVAREAVKLVHDAELDVRSADEREHLLETVSIGRTCGLTCVDELMDDARAEFLSLAPIRFALSRDRKPLCSAATFGLFAR